MECIEFMRPHKATKQPIVVPSNKPTVKPSMLNIEVSSGSGKTFTSDELQDDFYKRCNDFVATEADVAALRAKDYPLIDEHNIVYLDYTGSGLAASSQVADHMAALQSTFMSNPHSAGEHPTESQNFLENARAEVLSYFAASPAEYQVIFTQNATGALKLVGESFPFKKGSVFLVCTDNHNSVNGIESFSAPRGAKVARVPLKNCEMEGASLSKLLNMKKKTPSLFAYPAQSNLTSVQHSLEWIEVAKKAGWDVLLDIAAYCPTNRLDLSKHKPDFLSCSFYKMFGYPTGLGCLIVRRSALPRIAARPWFAGGTVSMVYPDGTPMMMPEDEPDRWEEGTVAFTQMAAVPIGLKHLQRVGIDNISKRVKCLAAWTIRHMAQLSHDNCVKLVKIHGANTTKGGSIAFNLINEEGGLISVTQVTGLAETAGIMMRSGCMCNPHASWHLLEQLNVQELRGWDAKAFEGRAPTDKVTIKELVDVVERNQDDCGIIRISYGIVSNFADAQAAIEFLQSFIQSTQGPVSPVRIVASQKSLAYLKSIAPMGLSKRKSIIPPGLLGLDSALSMKAVLVDATLSPS